MTGKDAILNYLKTHKTCSSPDVAAASGDDAYLHQPGCKYPGKAGGTGS